MNETFPIKQTKFSNGEVSPLNYGDTAHPKYGASLRTCLNWIPVPQGPLVKRPGTRLVSPVKDASYTPRQIPFFFSDGQTFVLEFGNLYARFFRQGKYVGNDGNLHTYGDAYAGGRYEIVTPFSTAMLPYLKFAQVGDTVTLCYGEQAAGVAAVAPQDLKHTSGANTPWTIAATPLKIPTGAVTWTQLPLDVVDVYTNARSYNKGDRCFTINAGTLTEWICIQETATGAGAAPPASPVLNSTGTSINGNLYWMPAVDIAHPAVKNQWRFTAMVQDANGVVFESQPSGAVTINSSLALDRQRPIGVINPSLTLAAGYTLLYLKLYRAPAGGLFGWIANLTYAQLQASYPGAGSNGVYMDDGRAPDFTKQPPAGTDPFLVSGADSYPSVVSYLDQRRLFAASLKLPASLFLSKAGDLYNFDGVPVALTPGSDADALLITLASEVLEQVRSFVPLRRGLILTAQGEWAIAGLTGGPVSRSSVDSKRQSTWGSSWLDPIKIGTGVLFNTAKSNMVRDLYPLYGLYADIWDGQDLSIMARHLFDLHTLRDWRFQSTPYPVVWAARDDGTLLSLTYQHAPPSFGQQLAEGICAWAQHTTGLADAFESVCVVPEPPEDAVYLGTSRVGPARYIERMVSPIPPASPYFAGASDVRYAVFLDCSVQYDGHNDQLGLGGNTGTIDSVAHPGSTALADYAVASQIKVTINTAAFVAADAANPYGSAFVFDPENLLGLNVLAPGGPGAVHGRIVGFTDTAHVTVELDAAMTQAQITAWRAGQTRWAIAKGQVTAAHLAAYPIDTNDANLARGVLCLADGDVQVPAAWAAGVASLATPAVVIQIGLAYNADSALLDAYHPSQEIRNKFKEVIRVGFELANTRDMWAGKDFSNLAQLQERSVLDAYSTMGLHTGYFELFVAGGFGKSGSAALRHFQPLPAAITAVLREMRLGDS